jgi:hypothetical protein
MFVCCECGMLSGRGLCDELITCPEDSYRLWYVVVCVLEASRMRRPWPALGRSATGKKIIKLGGPGSLSRYSDSLQTVRESNPGLGKIFRTCSHRPWGPPSLLYTQTHIP